MVSKNLSDVPELPLPSTAQDEVEVAPVRTFEQRKTEQEVARASLIDRMRDYFKTQKRVRVKVRNDSDVPVQINGYTFIIQKNVDVDVPEDVATILREADYI